MMDTLHGVLRGIRGETKSRKDHLTVFREFLNQLERANRKPAARARKPAAPRPAKRRK
jgi:hypothetical protein